MGELQHEPFQCTFNGFLKVAFQGSRITSDAGLFLVRELDERLGLATLIAEHLTDSRQGLNTQFSLADLLRQSVYSRLAGYEDLNDAVRVSADPTFRLIGSPKRWDRGAALTSTLHWFETELLTRAENLVELTARVQAALQRRAEPEAFVVGELSIRYDQRQVSVAGHTVELTATEYELLRVLSLNAGRVVTHDTLLGRVWDGHGGSDSEPVRTFSSAESFFRVFRRISRTRSSAETFSFIRSSDQESVS